ncbi:unnamed protein product [Vitrella brassicaformis CCMP3155]|uniref:Uncharacterized protein n=1 Tax=Vitrella brassicaformis (strain CCMP3155) TaxID=1169540 RepID=A0A0G4H3G0_VITBC|nr:unnamed protein product [Vitrella brassicaformis CCMP3155]|eukprot:CEM38154.1 unnamed protein product [Vitrella brassicaformis CCMP3155]
MKSPSPFSSPTLRAKLASFPNLNSSCGLASGLVDAITFRRGQGLMGNTFAPPDDSARIGLFAVVFGPTNGMHHQEDLTAMVVVGDCLVLQRTASLPMSGSGWSWAASLEGRGAVVVGREGDILMLSTADGEMVRQTDETTVAVLRQRDSARERSPGGDDVEVRRGAPVLPPQTARYSAAHHRGYSR